MDISNKNLKQYKCHQNLLKHCIATFNTVKNEAQQKNEKEYILDFTDYIGFYPEYIQVFIKLISDEYEIKDYRNNKFTIGFR